jgi:hypothetical protein
VVRPSQRMEMAIKAVKERCIWIWVACQAFRIIESCYRYGRKLYKENEEVATWLIKLQDNNRNLGVWPLLSVFAQSEGFQMEPHSCLSGLQRVGIELEDQTSQTFNS